MVYSNSKASAGAQFQDCQAESNEIVFVSRLEPKMKRKQAAQPTFYTLVTLEPVATAPAAA